MLSTKLITELGEISGLETTWRSLSEIDSRANLFNSFEWIESWIKFYWQPKYRLHLVLVETESKVVALLPLYFNSRENAIMFLGSGEEDETEVASEYLDFIIDSSAVSDKELFHYIAEYFRTQSSSNFLFENCLGTSHVFNLCKHLKRTVFELSGRQFRIHLDKPFEALVSDFSKNFQKKSREIINRFSKAEQLQFQPLSTEKFVQNWMLLRKLHTRNWNSRGKPGAFNATVFNQFHQHMQEHHPAIAQHFAILYSGDTAIAINHYYEFRGNFYFYLTGAEKEQYARFTPGLLLHTLCIRDLAGKPYHYDFMKGALRGSYKSKFCASSGEFFTIRVLASGPFNFLRYLRAFLRAKRTERRLQ